MTSARDVIAKWFRQYSDVQLSLSMADSLTSALDDAGFSIERSEKVLQLLQERDRLKAALEEIKSMPARIRENDGTSHNNKILFEAQQFVASACAAIARKALEGRDE